MTGSLKFPHTFVLTHLYLHLYLQICSYSLTHLYLLTFVHKLLSLKNVDGQLVARLGTWQMCSILRTKMVREMENSGLTCFFIYPVSTIIFASILNTKQQSTICCVYNVCLKGG